MKSFPIQKDEAEWQALLTPEQYYVTRLKGTERAFTGKLYWEKRTGTYHCVACGAPLFSSETKYDSGSGWPSFWAPISPDAIVTELDLSYGMRRIEVMCAQCGSHLGHVFDDGPRETTGLRYCINSISMDFRPAEDA
ncbi:MAG: peptide-methionine (R)-S-oxide reductase MsrB [Chloracidobacterium sp.]|nr:peptide-methionine (R)-S-oxide reductase MsrB [Chloracidobacterium sp.]MDW8218224.1 peptide-methionine (R)-S-oxide reductase MsrB [Acidobacteriota bacterium]